MLRRRTNWPVYLAVQLHGRQSFRTGTPSVAQTQIMLKGNLVVSTVRYRLRLIKLLSTRCVNLFSREELTRPDEGLPVPKINLDVQVSKFSNMYDEDQFCPLLGILTVSSCRIKMGN